MDAVFAIFFIWVFGWAFLADVLPGLIELVFLLVRFLLLCVWEVLKTAFYLIGWIVTHAAQGTSWLCTHAWLFLAIMFDEWRSGPQAGTGGNQYDHDDDDDVDDRPPEGPYEQALSVLGLTPPFTQADLKHVYREAMKRAHTDVGGNIEDAQALNAARDLVMKRHGWT